MANASLPILGLRGLQFFFTLLIMALVGNMIAEANGGNPSIVNYVMFVAVFSMLSIVYLLAATLIDLVIIPILPLIVDGLNTLFFLIGGIALAGYLGAHSCNDSDYTSNNVVTRGSDNDEKRCREGQANTAFLWFGFACYAASFALSLLNKSGSGGLRGGVGGIRRGGPSMSQV